MTTRHYSQSGSHPVKINLWDLIAFMIIFGLIGFMTKEAIAMARPYHIGQMMPIHLDPSYLPHYAVRSFVRILAAMFISLFFTFTIGTLAAKSYRAEKFIIPMIDILQSVPVLSFMSISITGFIMLFPDSLLGPECASIFVIFTSQAWNMMLGFYQSLRTLPKQLIEVAQVYQLSPWKIFWIVEIPFAMSPLLWNMMVSMSASWFFVVASEAIDIADQHILLPGIGSYIATAILQANIYAVIYAILAMFIVIFMYDQLIFRPLVHWAEKFKDEKESDDKLYHSWFIRLLERTMFMKLIGTIIQNFVERIIHIKYFQSKTQSLIELEDEGHEEKRQRRKEYTYQAIELIALAVFGGIFVYTVTYLYPFIPLKELGHVFALGIATSIRVFVMLILSSLFWVPIGVWIGLRPKLSQTMQPVIQFLAAFPANLFFPLVVIVIARFNLNVEIWTTPLMILGSQWYILFNVVAGTRAIPKELIHAMKTFHVKKWMWWRKLALPAIFPYYITGAISAAGGAWNASIVSEWVNWGPTTLEATGLGSYITQFAAEGDFPRVVLGTACMCVYVLLYNRFIWQPLYHVAEKRFSLE